MNTDVLLADLHDRGVLLVADGNRLRCRPKSLLTADDLAALRANKSTILYRLSIPRDAHRLVCHACRSRRFWQSVHGAIVCGLCHAPGSPDLVARWIGDTDEASP